MGTEKKSKSGSELPKGSAAPSCNPRLCACPGRCCFRGAAPKGSCPRPGLAGVSWVSQRSPITSAAPSPSASIGSGSCGGSRIKSWHPGAPFPAWRGGRGRQRDGGTQLALPCCCGGDHGSRGPPAEGWGGGQNPAGMGTPMGTSPRHGCWGLGARGALWDGGWQAARIKARQPSAGFGSGCAVCAQARTGAISGGGWVASRCPHMAAAPLM